MKQNLPLLWWLLSAVAIALVFVALGYDYDQAILLAVFFLPGMLALHYFVPQLSFEHRSKGILDAVYLLAAVVVIEYLVLILGHRVVFGASPDALHGVALHPLFIVLLLVGFIVPEQFIERYVARQSPRDTRIAFISDRRRVELDPGEILYVESNDDEVWIRTASGEAFRTKTRISQWEAQLDGRFQRVHRSYIVNTERIDDYHPARLRVGDRQIEISRKYKDQVRRRLGQE